MFQFAANVVMLMPLGFYLHYYFRLSLRTTVIIGLGASLFFELTQLTGLYFIYPKAYRFTQMDDLIANTLGALLGWVITPLLALVLPSREEIDRISYEKGEHVTVVRRAFAALTDVLAFALLAAVGAGLSTLLNGPVFWVELGVWIVCFILIPCVFGGRIAGQALLKLRTVADDGETPATFVQLVWRNFLFYGLGAAAAFLCACLLAAVGITLAEETMSGWPKLLLLDGGLILPVVCFIIVIRSHRKWGALPHSRWSHTMLIATE